MTYQEINAIVNNYMNESGIRNYCRNKCSGNCCRSLDLLCYQQDSLVCVSRLPCTLFLCDFVEAHIMNELGQEEGLAIVDLLREIDNIVTPSLRESFNTSDLLDVYLNDFDETDQMEFDVPSLDILMNPKPIEVFANA